MTLQFIGFLLNLTEEMKEQGRRGVGWVVWLEPKEEVPALICCPTCNSTIKRRATRMNHACLSQLCEECLTTIIYDWTAEPLRDQVSWRRNFQGEAG
jgi:hypothetical protein